MNLKRRIDALVRAMPPEPEPHRLIVWDEARMTDAEREAWRAANATYARLVDEIPGDLTVRERLMAADYADRIQFMKALRATRSYRARAPRR